MILSKTIMALAIENTLVKIFGWKAALFHGDPTTYDRWRWVKKHLSPGPLKTLDAGCGSGAMTHFAASIGNLALGLSFDDRNMRIASERAEMLQLSRAKFQVRDLRELPNYSHELGTFDQIVCLECIEHIINDQLVVSMLAQCLKPGGKLILSTPYDKYLPLYGDNPNQLSKTEDGGHVRWGYDEKRLRELCSNAGLEIKKVEFISGVIPQKLTSLIRRLDKILPHKLVWALTLPLRLLVPLDGPATRTTHYPHLSIGIVAHKP